MASTPEDNECDGCGRVFPLRQGLGSCSKCSKLLPHALGSTEYNEISAWPQCDMCSVTWRNLPKPLPGQRQTCSADSCIKAARRLNATPEPTAGEGSSSTGSSGTTTTGANQSKRARNSQDNIPEKYRELAGLMMNRLKRTVKGPAGTHHNTASLLFHETGGGTASEPKIMIAWQVRCSNRPKLIDGDLGSGAKEWAGSLHLPDLKEHIVKQINVEWQRHRDVPLLPDEVSIRWHDNQTLQPNTSTLTLQEFYDFYTQPSMAASFPNSIPPVWKSLVKRRTPLLCINFYIDMSAWTKRSEVPTENDNPSMIRSSVAGRRASMRAKRSLPDSDNDDDADEDSSRKRTRTITSITNTLSSEFRLSNRSEPSQIHTRSQVTLRKIICTINPTTGETEFEDTASTITGHIRDNSFSCGRMKHAYTLTTQDGKQLVAKRFFRLTDESESDAAADTNFDFNFKSSNVSVLDNKREVQAELSRLVIGQWFLNAFFRHARGCGVEVDTSISFAEAYLGLEINTPSIASGVVDINNPEGLTWLIEGQRPMSVIRYSGTLAHPTQRNDLRSLTIFAFAHFVYGHSNSTLIFADIQGTPTQVKGKDGLILFDVMTHTVDGDSGVGDFGPAGIQTFLKDHACVDLCRRLGLDQTAPLIFDRKGKATSRTVRRSSQTLVNEDYQSDGDDNDEFIEGSQIED